MKVIADGGVLAELLDEHRKSFSSTSDEAWDRNAMCESCRMPWPCAVSRAWAEAPLLDLVGAREARDILGVAESRFHLIRRKHDFPVPVAELAMGPVWFRREVQGYAEARSSKAGVKALV